MAEVTVQIEMDQGKFTVGMVPAASEAQPPAQPAAPMGAQPPQGEEQAEGSYMKPVASLDQALQVARDMLSGDTGAQAQEADKAEGQFRQGFAGSAPMGRPMPPGAA